jgi:type I restriction enzyme S subunit
MNNWKPYNLEQLAYYYNGMAFKPDDWKEEGIKIIRIEQLNNPTGHYDYYQGEVSENNGINNEDLIFSWSATLKVAIWKHGYGVLNQHLFKVVPKDIADKYFLYYLLDANMEKLGESSHGLTMKHIKRGELEKYIVSIPEIPEQQCIAKILSTCDAVIEKTQAAIAKYKAIKQGMLQDLFTRGIDLNTNKLRPRYEDAPELYKESKLGMIPREWEVDNLVNLCSNKPTYGINAAAVDFTYQLPTYLRITDIDEDGNFSKTGRKCVDSPFSENYILKKGDLVFARTGASVGKTYLYNEIDGLLVFAGFLIKVSPNAKVLDSNYLKFLTETAYYLNWVGLMSQRSAQPGINGNEYGSFLIPKPDLNEQIFISERLLAIQRKLQTEQTYLQKMQSLKKGLMEDLLSGKKCLNLDFQDEQINQDSKTILQSVNRVNQDADNYPVNPKIE